MGVNEFFSDFFFGFRHFLRKKIAKLNFILLSKVIFLRFLFFPNMIFIFAVKVEKIHLLPHIIHLPPQYKNFWIDNLLCFIIIFTNMFIIIFTNILKGVVSYRPQSSSWMSVKKKLWLHSYFDLRCSPWYDKS